IISEEELAVYSSGGVKDPKVKEYQDRLLEAQHLVLIFPIWWNVMPARLKGWMDKVLLPGFAFTPDQVPAPLLNHIQRASIFTTSGSPDDYHRKEYNKALEWVLSKGTLEFCGIKQVKLFNFGETGFAPRKKHEAWLEFVRDYSSKL
ncbi:MAG: NAD(P)H-dependent oxidoreductase, partial [Anaerolineaceae bacterium]|nr:NAD(P)H-dependent oxidoreductase [Anaerolineaceae bacterium]